ncbi:MAG: response regulator [Rhizobiaceae bacterium]|nr:MAG: response regulator [Rhizobiaceae bacterium]
MVIAQDTILVVDDEPLIRMSLAASFEDAGYQVLEARNVLQAIAIIARAPVAAVVTDVDMPGGLNGLDLVDLVAATSPSTALVVVSGRALPNDYELPEGARYHPKPYSQTTIVRQVGQMIAHLIRNADDRTRIEA